MHRGPKELIFDFFPPVISNGRMYGMHNQSVTAMMAIKDGYQIVKNWNGDPCSPTNASWNGVNCNKEEQPQITSL
jgi:Leucine rich repeat N-terminal domain